MATYGTNGAETINGTAGPDVIYAKDGGDTVNGSDANDTLRGEGGDDFLYGGAGNDMLDGGAGGDTMYGGIGNDVYVVDSLSDIVVEFANEGKDTVLSTISYTLGANLERLDLKGTGAIDGWGNELDNTLKGNAANNSLYGGAGADSISGDDGNDTILGGAGNDWLSGGNGIDTVSYADAVSAVTVSLANTTTGQITGGSGKDFLFGFENLTGSDFNDVLTGDAGDNKLTGGLGTDTMSGGAGDDRYSVDVSTDVVIEAAGEGIDQVLASADYVLSANVENLTLFGSAISGTGNALDNVIRGNANGNILTGGGGHDHLYGLGAADTFVFGAADASSSDHIHDFLSGTDIIKVFAADYGLPTGVLDSSYFVTTTLGMPVNGTDPFATAAHGQFIFDKYHNLYWDADGNGAGTAVLIANFGTSTVTAADIFVGP